MQVLLLRAHTRTQTQTNAQINTQTIYPPGHHVMLSCRYYFYGQDAQTGALVMVEMMVATEARQASFTLKTEVAELLPAFLEVWTNCLAGFYR